MGDRLATTDLGRKEGGCCAPFGFDIIFRDNFVKCETKLFFRFCDQEWFGNKPTETLPATLALYRHFTLLSWVLAVITYLAKLTWIYDDSQFCLAYPIFAIYQILSLSRQTVLCIKNFGERMFSVEPEMDVLLPHQMLLATNHVESNDISRLSAGQLTGQPVVRDMQSNS